MLGPLGFDSPVALPTPVFAPSVPLLRKPSLILLLALLFFAPCARLLTLNFKPDKLTISSLFFPSIAPENVLPCLPPSPISAAHLLLLAGACDVFHVARDIYFQNVGARSQYIKSRVKIFVSRLGTKIWLNIHTELPRRAPPLRRRVGRKFSRSATSLFCSYPLSLCLGSGQLHAALGSSKKELASSHSFRHIQTSFSYMETSTVHSFERAF